MKVNRAYTRQPIPAFCGQTVAEAAALMRRLRLPCLYVLETRESGRVAGILTSQDLMLHALAQGAGSQAPLDTSLRPVGGIVTEQTELTAAFAEMRRLGVTELLVTTEAGDPAGVLSLGDVRDVMAHGAAGFAPPAGPGAWPQPAQPRSPEHIPQPIVVACYVVILLGLFLGLVRAATQIGL